MTSNGAVTLAYCHPAEVAHSWHRSVVDLLGHDAANHQRVMRGGYIAMRCGTGQLIEARNRVVEMFLTRDSEWLWWIDSDMGFKPDTIDRLVEAADPVERPIVGGLCFAQRELEEDGRGGYRCESVPTLYRWAKAPNGQEGFTAWYDYPRDQMAEVSATGSACILIHRDVLEKVGADSKGNWYGRLLNPSVGDFLSEDLSFCGRAAQAGYPIHVDTRVKTTHLKQLWLAETDHEWQQARRV